jgi:predicted GNAT superfamily acetyltransferase
MQIRPLTTIEDCRRVAALEREIWGYGDSEDVVPPPMLVVSIGRGGILLGAFGPDDRMQGFVYSLPALKQGRLIQWSHMLGVVPEARGAGLGTRLKLAQRDAALTMGIDLIEWTFDPLQVANAHFNFATLGVVVEEYAENLYGDSASPLHAGTPTDRFIAEWRITLPHVERRLAARGQPVVRDQTIAGAPLVNPSLRGGTWLVPGPVDLAVAERRLLVEIPAGFVDLQRADPSCARAWRLQTREIFETYFARGYRAVDFFRSQDAGHYLLARDEPGRGP